MTAPGVDVSVPVGWASSHGSGEKATKNSIYKLMIATPVVHYSL